jgi:hypothetical protein
VRLSGRGWHRPATACHSRPINGGGSSKYWARKFSPPSLSPFWKANLSAATFSNKGSLQRDYQAAR